MTAQPSDPTEHRINIKPARKPHGGKTKYRAWCLCGGYESRLFNFPGQAENAGLDHVKEKTR